MVQPSPSQTNRKSSLAPHLECIPCLTRQAHEAVVAATSDPQLRDAALRQALELLACLNWHLSPPALAQQMHRLIRDLTHNPDPYAAAKKELDERAAHLDIAWHQRFAESFPPLEAAVRLAIAGNLLDVGAKTQLGEEELPKAFEKALTAPLVGSVPELEAAISQARYILFLADNAGEIIFDRWLLTHLPLGRFTVVVRGAPVLNDATLADAQNAELDDFCDIISNGSDAPGTLVADCSEEFRGRFKGADLIIAKGQGNYESLADTDKNIFFLFTIKCPVVSWALGAPVGSLMLYHQQPEGVGPATVGRQATSATPQKLKGAAPPSVR